METRRHVTLLVDRNATETHALIGPDGKKIASFGIFASTLGAAWNTKLRYCSGIADFYDYFYEAAILISGQCDIENLTSNHIREIIGSWKNYLIFGLHSDDHLAKRVAQVLPSPQNSETTASNKHAALTAYLRLSESLRTQSISLAKAKLKPLDSDCEPLLSALYALHHPGYLQRCRMIQASMLSAMLMTGSGVLTKSIFRAAENTPFDSRRIFPFDNFGSFINTMSSYRDKALHCLYAALGSRGHEARQLLWEDIDIETGEIRLVNPATRINHKSYLALSKKDRQKLCWKGRTTQLTFAIEPFISMFFENLQHYQREEYFPHGKHSFVFQITKKGDHLGRPYFATDSKTRHEVFCKAAAAISLPSHIDGVHCLRHAYGTYLLNYLPMPDGSYGMPIGYVRIVMGHKSIINTEKYAKVDQDLIRAALQHGNINIFKDPKDTQSINSLKIAALNAQIAQLEKSCLEPA